ncbi:hypothetical protein C8N32_12411 [Rhodovulum imhoffii]|uniref:Uncharacterized protein n=1 Tax=Rhodovulum imhoffii TaxID=365340 RepID=A0A2T5BNY2_9RHOB|nr:hypothetical protein C8N32_12411 [Rhodovulum imhoffii]
MADGKTFGTCRAGCARRRSLNLTGKYLNTPDRAELIIRP